MRSELLRVCAYVFVGGVVSCSLNPQPLPPDSPIDAGNGLGTIATPTVGDSGHRGGVDAGEKGPGGDDASGGGEPDASQTAGDDGGEDAGAPNGPDGGPASDAGADAPSDDAALDGSHGDATPPDAGAYDAAPAPDSGS